MVGPILLAQAALQSSIVQRGQGEASLYMAKKKAKEVESSTCASTSIPPTT